MILFSGFCLSVFGYVGSVLVRSRSPVRADTDVMFPQNRENIFFVISKRGGTYPHVLTSADRASLRGMIHHDNHADHDDHLVVRVLILYLVNIMHWVGLIRKTILFSEN